MRTLVTIAVDESTGELVALTGTSKIEVARMRPVDESHHAHMVSARALLISGLEALHAEGYPRAGLCERSSEYVWTVGRVVSDE